MILGPIAVPRVPGECPDETDEAEEPKAGAPTPAPHESQRNRHREHAAHPRPQEHDAVRPPALDPWKPAREAARDVRERARLAGAEQKADREQRLKSARG